MQHVSRTPPSGQNQTIDQKLLFQMQLFHKILRRLQRRLFQISRKLDEKNICKCVGKKTLRNSIVWPIFEIQNFVIWPSIK